MSVSENKKLAVFMIDGFDIEYYHQSDMPNMEKMAKEGFFKQGSCIFPSLTNANNISIASGYRLNIAAMGPYTRYRSHCWYIMGQQPACIQRYEL